MRTIKFAVGKGSIVRDAYYLDVPGVDFLIYRLDNGEIAVEVKVETEDKAKEVLELIDNLGGIIIE